jgi:hypothetical protein
LRAYRIHAISRRGDEDLFASRRDADTHEKVDDLIRTDTKKDVIRTRQAAQLCYAALYSRVGWIRIAVEIKAEEWTVEIRVDVGVPVGPCRRGGRKGVLGVGDWVTEGILVRI